jgi:ubiquinone/menaquinone biosynthesis C-methylase UbiE
MVRRVDYDRIATTYDRRYRENDYSGVEAAIVAFVGERCQQRVLEVGCGTGHWLDVLARRGIGVTGVDPSAGMLAQATIHTPRGVLVQGSAEHLPYARESLGRVFCINAFHHFEDKVAFVSEGMRVLQPGGRILTVGLDPHAGVDRWYIYDYFDTVLEIDRRRYPATSQIRTWMQAAGFADCATHEIQHLPVRLDARVMLERGRLDRGATSQLSLLTDEEYRRGLGRIHQAVESAEARGDSLHLDADLRLYATFGTVPSRSE